MHTSVVELSDELVAALFHESPLSAFLMGLDDVDVNLSDLSRDAQLADIATYTSLGLGDIVPTGDVRMMTGAEALNGLVLIGWSVTYSFLAMEDFWERPKPSGERRG